MNEPAALRVVMLCHDAFGSLVSATMVRDESSGPSNFHVVLYHRRLHRIVSLTHAEDWPVMRDCWRVATDGDTEPPQEHQPPKSRRNLWSFWH